MLQKSGKKKDIAQVLAVKYKLTDEQANNLLTDLFEMIGWLVLQKQKVCIFRFGSFFLRKKKPRSMNNPRTGVPMLVAEKTIMYFRASRFFNRGLCAQNQENISPPKPPTI